MSEARKKMKMPELLLFARLFSMGLLGAEVFRLTYYVGKNFAPLLAGIDWQVVVAGIAICLFVCLTYAVKRDALAGIVRIGCSLRVDLLALTLLGAWSNVLFAPWLKALHDTVQKTDPLWAPSLLGVLLLVLLSPLLRTYWPRQKATDQQFYFLTDDEISTKEDDVLQNDGQAKVFADTVLASCAHSSLVFGVDGPWGTGKTSFINLAERHWESVGSTSTIVFRFEPLRYAADPDLSERFIRDLTASIQRQVFAPEFRPAASRYTRMLKGKTDFSFLGFKLSLEPSSETIDELLEDIDDVLKRIRRRVIVVVDDLDRLEAKTVNNVLFTIRRTFKLSQATYILCYDTENLVGSKDEGGKAREFLEKFVNVKLSLFVDYAMLRSFLLTDWKRDERRFPSISSETMFKLSAVLNELADILDGDKAFKYAPLIGDMRKLKRFVNAVLLMQIEKTDLAKTDFSRHDLVHLMLLHLNYPGLFRRIYSEETEGRSGVFSMKRASGSDGRTAFANDGEFATVASEYKATAGQFLLEQLFDVKVLGFEKGETADELVMASRACFNTDPYRNLEKYLKLIVRFVVPEPRATFRLYQDAVDRVVKQGASIESILEEPAFSLQDGELAHDQFWRLLLSQSYDFTLSVAEDAINTLVKYLPRYSTVDTTDGGLRDRSIYSLIRLLDRAGWGRTGGRRRNNTPENIVEIAQRIYGEGPHTNKGIICSLTSESRGVLGWHDLLVFRLQCSADRGGQVHEVHSALILHEDMNAPIAGLVSMLALNGMRVFSQQVFRLFRDTFIAPGRNFLSEVDTTPDADFLGESEQWLRKESRKDEKEHRQLTDQVLQARSSVKSFVIYQLANRDQPNGSGVGCGLYDESGKNDLGGIGSLVSKYFFDVCFNPTVSEDNIFHFVDYCLSNLSNGFWSGRDEEGLVATERGLAGKLDLLDMKKYWSDFGPLIKDRNLTKIDRRVVTSNYVTTYGEHLEKVFFVLDSLVEGTSINQG